MQEEGVDYGDTYAPVRSIITVRCLLAIGAAKGYHVWQADVKKAFLHGDLDKPLYISQPEGYGNGSNKVLKLNKALYGLKQSPLCWYSALQKGLQEMGFTRCPAELALFFKDELGSRVWVIVYVDDLMLVSPMEQPIERVFQSLSNKFHPKRIDTVCTYLGV